MPSNVVVIHSDPEILGGTPVFVGTRVPFDLAKSFELRPNALVLTRAEGAQRVRAPGDARAAPGVECSTC